MSENQEYRKKLLKAVLKINLGALVGSLAVAYFFGAVPAAIAFSFLLVAIPVILELS